MTHLSIHDSELMKFVTTLRPARFRYYRCKDQRFTVPDPENFHLLFVMEGEGILCCNEFVNRKIKGQECVLIPIAADMIFSPISPVRLMLLSFDDITCFSQPDYFRELWEEYAHLSYDFKPLSVHSPLDHFLDSLSECLESGIDEQLFHRIKQEEMFLIFQWFYEKREIAALFYPLLGNSFEFRKQVLLSYRKVNNVEELATLCGMTKNNFDKLFKIEYGVSPEKWLNEQQQKNENYINSEIAIPLEIDEPKERTLDVINNIDFYLNKMKEESMGN